MSDKTRLSARRLGERIGLSAREMNRRLVSHGYLKGTPGHYLITVKGEQRGEVRAFDNGYGGFAYRQWDYVVWDEDLADELRDG